METVIITAATTGMTTGAGVETIVMIAVIAETGKGIEMVVIEKDSAMDMIVDGETIEVCLMEVESLVRPVGMVQIPSAILSLTTFAAVMARHDNGACGTLQGTSFHFAKTSTVRGLFSSDWKSVQMRKSKSSSMRLFRRRIH